MLHIFVCDSAKFKCIIQKLIVFESLIYAKVIMKISFGRCTSQTTKIEKLQTKYLQMVLLQTFPMVHASNIYL